MAKQGQHKHDANDHNVSRKNNNAHNSQEIVTGSYKKPETYKKQAALHQDLGKTAQHSKIHHVDDTRDNVTHEANSDLRAQDHHGRSGSESNPGKGS